jgi:hypothetical protein
MAEQGNPQKSTAAERWRVNPDELSLRLDPAELGFQTTAEVPPLDTLLGQDRALAALELGLSIRKKGYNIYVSGMMGSGRKQLVQQLLKERASNEPTPPNWVYLHNFQEPFRAPTSYIWSYAPTPSNWYDNSNFTFGLSTPLMKGSSCSLTFNLAM